MIKTYALGMDTSKHQASKVDYAKAKQAGYGFVILRIGYKNTIDTCFERDYASAVAAGLKVGVYYYTMSKTVSEGAQDASRVLGWLNGKHLDLPIYYDLEDASQKGESRANANTQMYLSFRAEILSDGKYSVGLYSGEYFFNHYFNKNGLDENLWIAKYSSNQPSVGKTVTIWQYTSDAVNAPYYNGKLDRNYMLVDMISDEAKDPGVNPYAEPTRTLKKTLPCMKGNDVKWLQWELKITVDGIFGKNTLAAVKRYQGDYGLKVDGIVGPATRYALKND